MDETRNSGMETAGCQGTTTVTMTMGAIATRYVLAFGDGTAYLANVSGGASLATCRSGPRRNEMSPHPDASPQENAC